MLLQRIVWLPRRMAFAWRTGMWCVPWLLQIQHDRCWPLGGAQVEDGSG
jgi:hypothetical protein